MVIGSLAVNIVANTSKFASGLTTASERLTNFAKGVTALQAGIAGLIGAGFISWVRSAATEADALGDMAERLGIGAEALQGLQFAAEQMGSSAAGMERSLSFMVKSLGNTASAKAFENIGLSVRELQRLSPDQVFLAVADGIRAIDNPARQSAAAVAIFGRAGMELLPIIRGGREEVVKFQEQLATNGGMIRQSEIDALGQLADKMVELDRAFRAFRISFMAAFGDTFVLAVQGAIDILGKFREQQVLIKIAFLEFLDLMPADLSSDLNAAYAELSELQRGASARPIMRKPPVDRSSSEAAGGIGTGSAMDAMTMFGLQALMAMTIKESMRKRGPVGGGMAPGMGMGMMGMNFAMMANMAMVAAMKGQFGTGGRMEPLEALIGGTREAYVASRENLGPRKADPLEKLAQDAHKQTALQEMMEQHLATLAAGGGAQVIGGMIGN